jgi:hypothetical protein
MFLGIVFILTISFILPGCYTQLSRPRVDTEDEYYDKTEDEEVEEYYQDEGVPSTDDSRDVYIYNYYPYYWNDYYDYWYYSPDRWRYIGPYPHYWWDPYAHWWTPGWYVGSYYYDYWWGDYPRYHHSYPRYGYYTRDSGRTFEKRPFTRRSIRMVDRERRIDSQTSLAKPITPDRVERPRTTLSTPSVRDNSISTEQRRRTVKEMVNRRLRSQTKSPKVIDDRRTKALTKKSPTVREPKTVKVLPRSSKSNSKPNLIERAPSKQTKRTSKTSYSPPQRSNQNYSSGSRSSSTQVSRSATRSYTPRSSSSSSGTRSSTPSSPSRSSGSSSSSKSSGSSKSGKK